MAQLESVVSALADVKAEADRLRADRDRLILELASQGVPRKKLAHACGTAEVSIYKILEKQRSGL